MRKSILLIDTPESCNECILSGEYIYCTGEIISGENICHGCRGHNYDSAKKPDWCPLQVVPEKMEVCGRYPQPDGIAPSYKIGWNKCIDKILKNKERWLKWENGKEWGEIQCPMLNDTSVMTYYPEGAPCYYSYTAPFVCDGDICYYRYDHDEGGWDCNLYSMGEYAEDVSQKVFFK